MSRGSTPPTQWEGPSNRSCVLILLFVLLPIPAAVFMIWLWWNLHIDGDTGFVAFIIIGAFPIGWSFTGIGCWVLGRLWKDRLVQYLGVILFLIGFSMVLYLQWLGYEAEIDMLWG